MKQNIVIIITTLLIIFGLYHFAFRPWMFTWGASKEDLAKSYPGDELLPKNAHNRIRVITINTPVEKIFPYFRQLGQDRAGFYSYDFLEQLFGAEIYNTYTIKKEWQERKQGDAVLFAPKDKFNGMAKMYVAVWIPNKAMIFVTPDDYNKLKNGNKASGLWGFVLEPIDKNTTKLVMLSKGIDGVSSPFGGKISTYLFWDNAHFIMERKMMLTLKQLAEREE